MAIVAYLISLVIYRQGGSIIPERNSESVKARKYLLYSKGTKSARAFFIKNTQNLFSKTIGYAFVNHLPLK